MRRPRQTRLLSPLFASMLLAMQTDVAAPAAPPDTRPSETVQAPPPLPPALPALPSTLESVPPPVNPPTPPVPATLPATEPASAEAVPSTSPAEPNPLTLRTFPQTQVSAAATQESPTTSNRELTLAGTTEPSAEESSKMKEVLVTADLDRSREQIAPALGAVKYTIGPNQIEAIPGGENAPLQQVLLRAPGVVEDSFGQLHVRGEHANITYRVNGVLLPQPINVFGQELDTRIINSVTLIDGTLPAEFGLHTAGIIDVTTKSGASLTHNELSLYGGSYDTIQPSLQLGGTVGKLDYFVVASYNYNGIGIENPTSGHRPLHDYTDQERLFTYLNYNIDDTSRLSLFVNAYDGQFQIPDQPGLPKLFTLAGDTTASSAKTNERQDEQEYYTVLAYQKTADKLAFQVSGFTRYGQISFDPDFRNDLIFQGVSGAVYNNYLTYGIQGDSSYVLNDQHTIRAGIIGDYTSEKLDTDSAVFPADSTGAQTANVPIIIDDNSSNEALEAGIYVQDEWKLTRKLTLNYGLRYDRFDANFDHEGQFSPRANVVYKIDNATTAHAGYARYFVPPPVQDVRPSTLARFANTTNAPANLGDSAPRVERSDYYDAGLSRQITPALQINVDGFYKDAHQLVDLGQFGDAIILSPYNYREGRVEGAELSSIYKEGGFSAFANFSWVKTLAHGIDSQQFEFDPDELAFINTHNIKLDHESEYTVSAGASYTWKDNKVYVDFLYGSGLRAGFANQQQEPQYYPVNVGYEHIFHPSELAGHPVKFRVDVVNVFDQSYQLRNGTGLGVNAPQFGERRAFFAGLTYEF